MIFIELPLFQKRLQFTDEELRALQNDLLKNPRRGGVIKVLAGCERCAHRCRAEGNAAALG